MSDTGATTTRTIQGHAMMYGTPVFSMLLLIDDPRVVGLVPRRGKDGVEIFADLSGYRPDPKSIMVAGKKYSAMIKLQHESILDTDIWIPREIYIFGAGQETIVLTYIR